MATLKTRKTTYSNFERKKERIPTYLTDFMGIF